MSNLPTTDKPVNFTGSFEDIQKLFPRATREKPATQSIYARCMEKLGSARVRLDSRFSIGNVKDMTELSKRPDLWPEFEQKVDAIIASIPVTPENVAADVVNDLKAKLGPLAHEYNVALKAGDAERSSRAYLAFRSTQEHLKNAIKIQADLAKFTIGETDAEIVFTSLADIIARRSETQWLPGLDEILERHVLAVMAAERETFKSFISLDWSMLAAVAGCAVIMLSGEGGGLDRRVAAWLVEHGKGVEVEKLKFVALEKPVNLNEQQTLDMVAAAVAKLGWPSVDLIVIDTMSKFTPGLDEQDNTANAEFQFRVSETFRHQLGASVLIVDHAGHTNKDRPRGASVKMANPDAEYMVTRPDIETYDVTVSRKRFKDSPHLPDLVYTGKVVDLGRVDRHGRPITSLAFIRSNAPATVAKKPTPLPKLKGNAHTAWEALKPLFAAGPTSIKDVPTCAPKNVVALNEDEAIEAMRGKFRKGKHQMRDVTRGIDGLIKAKYLERGDGWIWPRLIQDPTLANVSFEATDPKTRTQVPNAPTP